MMIILSVVLLSPGRDDLHFHGLTGSVRHRPVLRVTLEAGGLYPRANVTWRGPRWACVHSVNLTESGIVEADPR